MNTIKLFLQTSLIIALGIFIESSAFAVSARLEKSGSRHSSIPTEAGNIISLADTKNAAGNNEPVVKEGAEITLSGRLKGGMAGIGGEHTGWVLEYQTKAGPQTIEVDLSGIDATKTHEGPARITGKIFKKNYIERGPVLILKAIKIDPL